MFARMDDLYAGSAVGLTTLLVEMVAGMGSMGLVMAIVGLYGLVAYSVSRRTREIGIRVAVGAHPSSVLRMVLRHGLLLAVGGIARGIDRQCRDARTPSGGVSRFRTPAILV